MRNTVDPEFEAAIKKVSKAMAQKPTQAEPGSPLKAAILWARDNHGLPMHLPGDKKVPVMGSGI